MPVEGTFADGTGTFECDDTWEGRPVRVRYQWLDTASAQPRWEQSFSPDGGQTWEVNWSSVFRRSGKRTRSEERAVPSVVLDDAQSASPAECHR